MHNGTPKCTALSGAESELSETPLWTSLGGLLLLSEGVCFSREALSDEGVALSQSFDLGAPKYCCEVARFCHPNLAEVLLNFSRMARCELANKC